MSYLREFKPKALGGKYKVICETFADANEITEVSNRRPQRHEFDHDFTRSRVRSSFHGVDTWDEACDLLKYGYKEVVPKLSKMVEMTAKGEATKTSFRNDVVGYAPVVPLALRGVPKCMINSYKKPVKDKVVNIYLDRTALCQWEPHEIVEATSNFVAALTELELQGYRFNVTVVKTNANSSVCNMLTLKVKDANLPIDLQRMSYPLMHTAFARVTCWDWYSRCPQSVHITNLGRHLGGHFSSEKIVNALEEMFNERCILFQLEEMYQKSKEYIEEVIVNANTTMR